MKAATFAEDQSNLKPLINEGAESSAATVMTSGNGKKVVVMSLSGYTG